MFLSIIFHGRSRRFSYTKWVIFSYNHQTITPVHETSFEDSFSTWNLGLLICSDSIFIEFSASSNSMMALVTAFDKSLSSLTSKKHPRACAFLIIFCQTELLLDKVVPFPTIHKQCLHKNKNRAYCTSLLCPHTQDLKARLYKMDSSLHEINLLGPC